MAAVRGVVVVAVVAKAASTEFGEARGRVLFLRTGLIHERDEIAGTRLNCAGVDKRRKGSVLKPGPAWPEMRQLTRRATDLCRYSAYRHMASHHPHYVFGYILASVEFHLQQIDMVFGVRVIAGDSATLYQTGYGTACGKAVHTSY